MKKTLPVSTPLLNCYTKYGTLFSILDLSNDPWAFNNFIQLVYVKEWDMFTYEAQSYILEYCPYLICEKFSDALLNPVYQNDLSAFIMNAINQGKYLFLWVDRYHLPVSASYQKHHVPHELFIYGYDQDSQEIYIADNLQHGKFTFTKCGFRDINAGHFCLHDIYDMRRIMTIQVNPLRPLASSPIDVPRIKHSLEFYLNSLDFIYVDKEPKISGIKILDHMLALAPKKQEYDLRAFHLLYEHSLFMERRVSYLAQNNLLTCHTFDVSPYTQLKNNALIMRNLVIKHQLTHDAQLFQKLKMMLLNFKDMQIKLFTDLILMLDDC